MKNLNLKNLTLMMMVLTSSISFSQNWLTNGNAAGANNFLGTTNGTSLTIKTSNTTRMTILHTSGNVGIGTTAPAAQLHTTGTIRFQGLISNPGNMNFVVADASGNLAVRDINTIMLNNTWNTTGNAGGGFLGTFGLSALPFRTNNIERLRITETGLIGIGISTPTAQFHTTGTVRFQGLISNPGNMNFVVADASGNLAVRDINTIMLNNTWNTTGNAGGGFLGTFGLSALPFRTNNIERLRITEIGLIGIGISTPTAQLHTTSTVRFAGLTQANGLPRLLATDASGNISYKDISTLNDFWKSTGNNATGSEFIGTNNGTDLIFKTNTAERLRITSVGNTGIGTTAPTTRLHVNCNSNITTGVRFELLPMAPNGTVLVQDPQGNVLNSGIDVITLVNFVQNKNEESLRIAALEKELQELKALLKKANPTSITPTETKATLYQNYPNPTGGFTNIKVVVEENNATVQCNIYDINNTLVQSHAIKGNGEQILSVDTQSLSSTVYFYTLEINGKVIDSKKLIIQK